MIIVIHMTYLFLKGELYKELIPYGLFFGVIEIFGEVGAIALFAGQ